MSTVLAAVIAGLFSLGAVVIANFYARIRRDLDACLRDRRQLRQTMQLITSALVGLLQPDQRDALLIAITHAIDGVDEAV